MRRLAITLITAIGIAGGVACGLELAGEGGPPDIPLPERDDGGNNDATPVIGELPESGADILPGETTIDAGEVDAGSCGPTGVQENFANGIDNAKWVTYGKVTRVVTGNNNIARLIETDDKEEAAGMMFVPKVTATEFTASFYYFAQLPYVGWFESANYADGYTLTWLTEGDPATLGTAPQNVVSGAGLGFPNATKGYAFAMDLYRNSAPQDLDGPSFYVVGLDGAKGAPGSYPWHLRKSGPWSGVYDSWHKVDITLAGGKLSATIDTTVKIFENIDVPVAPIKAIGFTAATGGGKAVGFFIDTVDIKLTNATCP